MESFTAVIERFGCPEMARLLGRPYQTVASWKLRNVLPSRFWQKIVEEAVRRDLNEITLEALANIDAKRPGDISNNSTGQATSHAA